MQCVCTSVISVMCVLILIGVVLNAVYSDPLHFLSKFLCIWNNHSILLWQCFSKIASAGEILSSMEQDVNTVIVLWMEGRGHLSNNSEGRHCAEGGLIMERDDIGVGKKMSGLTSNVQ